jgi:hypothetical protein
MTRPFENAAMCCRSIKTRALHHHALPAQAQTGALGIADLLVVVMLADAAQNAMGSEYKSVTVSCWC